ncbi:tape measure protein [Orbus mooreae]|uniref:tape measure protein n=1 Tax=Orbus mooreae TaxID=3074107 RepID=UPI00370D4B28
MATYTEGSVVYEVSLDTKNLLENSGKVREQMLKLNDNGELAAKGLNKVEASASSAGNSLGKLTTIAKAVSAALISSQILAYAQSWNELEDRIGNTGATAIQTKEIMDKLLETSNRNGRTIEESSELYIRLSNAMKELGYSANDTLSYIGTLSNLMTINKTNALAAQSATNALTKAQMAGKLAGENANSVFNAMPSILKTLGTQLKKTETEVRQMASDGKLSMKIFSDAMIGAENETAAFADNMRNTVNDGVTRVTNNLKQYLGNLNNSTGATKLLVDSLVLMSQHVDVLVNGLGVLAAIYAGKYVTSLAAATKQSAEKVITDIKQAASEKAAAQSALQQAQAELANRVAAQKSMVAQLELAQTERTRNAIRGQLKANTIALTVATNAEAAAQARLNAALKASSFAANGLKSAMNMLGGPAGILLIAAGAFISWSTNAEQAKQKSLELADNIDALTDSFKKMTAAQMDSAIYDLDKKIQKQTIVIKEQEAAIKNFQKTNSNVVMSTGVVLSTDYQGELKNLKAELDTMRQVLDQDNELMSKYVDAQKRATESTKELKESTKVKNDEFSKDTTDNITKNIAKLSQELEIAELKQKGLTKEAYIYQGVLSALGDEASKYQVALKGLITGTSDISNLTDEHRAKLEPLITLLGKMYNVNAQGAPKVKAASEKLKELKDNLKGLADPLEKENTSFNESAKVLKDSLTQKLLTQEQYDKKSEQLQKQHQLNLAKINSDEYVSQKSQAVAQVDPVQALMNEQTRKLALIKEFEKNKSISEQQALELREAANHQYEQNRINAQWEIWRNQSEANEFLASSLEGLASSATSTISGLMSGTMSATDAMQNFANVILNETIGSLVQMGLQQVKNAITSQAATAGATAAQITEAAALETAWTGAAIQASIATQGAAATIGQSSYMQAIGTMRAVAIAGGREHGGTVNADSMYRVGEGGKPEILMSGGKQYMIPGENGRVLSNREITSSSGGKSGVSLSFNMPIDIGDSSVSEQDGQQLAKLVEQVVKAKIQSEMRPGGLLNKR